MVVTTQNFSGNAESFKVEDVVRVSDAALQSGRLFDFGEIHKVNSDGTVQVLWNEAGCGCNGVPNESIDQLTRSTAQQWDAYLQSNTLPDGVEQILREHQPLAKALLDYDNRSTVDTEIIASSPADEPVDDGDEDEWDEDDEEYDGPVYDDTDEFIHAH